MFNQITRLFLDCGLLQFSCASDFANLKRNPSWSNLEKTIRSTRNSDLMFELFLFSISDKLNALALEWGCQLLPVFSIGGRCILLRPLAIHHPSVRKIFRQTWISRRKKFFSKAV